VGLGRTLGALAAFALAAAACARREPTARPYADGESETFRLHIRVSGNGVVIPGGLGGPCADDCSYRALRGKTVQLQAVEREDVFHRWSRRCGRAPSCKVEMTSDISISAEFGLDRYEPAWAVPVTASECVFVTGLAAVEHVFVTGAFGGTANVGRDSITSNGGQDAFIASLRRHSGESEWSRAIGGRDFDVASHPATLPGSDLVAALSLSDGARVGGAAVTALEERVAWMNADDGTVHASVALPAAIEAIRRLPDGGAVVVTQGNRRSTVTRFNANGVAPSWSADLAASLVLSFQDLAIGPSGDIFVMGKVRGVPLFAGLGSQPESGWFLARLDGAIGAVRNAAWLGRPTRSLDRLASDGLQLMATGGDMGEWDDAFVLAMSFEGQTRWERHYRGTSARTRVSIRPVIASRESSFVAGDVVGEIELFHRRIGRRNATTGFILELSPAGEILWSFVMPPEVSDIRALALDGDGDVYVTGGFRDTFEFGGRTIAPDLSGRECTSAYVAKFVRTGDRSPRPH
jgi:hypothetical protein